MPSTPNWNIPYPCSGDNIDCTVFEDFTQAIQDAITAVDALSVQVRNRPAAAIDNSFNTIPVGVSTNVQFALEDFDNANMVNLAVNNDRITITVDGMYLVNANLYLTPPSTTVTSNAVAITRNGTVLYRKKSSSDTNDFTAMTLAGLVPCVAGDILRLSALWTGTGGPAATFIGRLSAQFVALP